MSHDLKKKCHVIRVGAQNVQNTHCFSNGRCFRAHDTNRMTSAVFHGSCECFFFFSDHVLKFEPRPIQISNGRFTTLVILIVRNAFCILSDYDHRKAFARDLCSVDKFQAFRPHWPNSSHRGKSNARRGGGGGGGMIARTYMVGGPPKQWSGIWSSFSMSSFCDGVLEISCTWEGNDDRT